MSDDNNWYAPSTDTSPVAATTAGVYTFSPPVSVFSITNATGQYMLLRFGDAAASASVFDGIIPAGETRVILARDYGMRAIKKISVWYPDGATPAAAIIRGM